MSIDPGHTNMYHSGGASGHVGGENIDLQPLSVALQKLQRAEPNTGSNGY